jgi:hypothetical protein
MKLLNLATALILGCGIPLSIQTLAPVVAVAVSAYPEGNIIVSSSGKTISDSLFYRIKKSGK